MSFKRLATGGRIDRARPLAFTFDGWTLKGFAGDTLASALLANNRMILGRSMKYHRPRGLLAAGVEEPNALMTVGRGGAERPNLPATTVELAQGLRARSQNAFPSRLFDLRAIHQAFAPLLGAGFYYKTFMGPKKGSWMFYEKQIRKAAGFGRTHMEAADTPHHTRHAFTDLLIVGSGAAGLAAALTAAESGLRITLAEQDFELGGHLLSTLDETLAQWREQAIARLQAMANVRLLPRATVKGLYDGMLAAIAVGDDLELLRARAIIIAAGATERPLLFENNDRPGIFLASALATYAARFAVAPAKRCVIATNNDAAYGSALTLASLGTSVIIADQRREISGGLLAAAAGHGIAVYPATVVAKAHGGPVLDSVTLAGPWPETVACDALGVSGGLSPTVHLTSHGGVKPVWNGAIAALVPGPQPEGLFAAGACAGELDLKAAVADAEAKAQAAVRSLGHKAPPAGKLAADLPDGPAYSLDVETPKPKGAKTFVDFQSDVTAKDIAQALDEGYANPELFKRYTTLGMGTDQGKTSNINALMLAGAIVPTTFRPPFTPFLVGQIAGRGVSSHFKPLRLSPLHDWHASNGATFIEAGLWKRAWFYDWAGSTVQAAYVKEMEQVRRHVGLADISTLGKIGVSGKDAAEFLDRVYVNAMKSLAIGKARYGVMLNDDGLVMDDGTVARIGPQQYYVTTTTAMAGEVMAWMEKLAQMHWPELDVHLVSLTDQFGGMSLAGPRARDVLQLAFPGQKVDGEALPHMGVVDFVHDGLPIRILRMTFSGELAYEIHCPADATAAVWAHVLAAGAPHGIKPYGLESLAALRIEKGHVAAPELDHRVGLDDLGLGGMASKKKSFVGEVLRKRGGMDKGNRPQLVGLELLEPEKTLRGGAILFAASDPIKGHGRGHVTSVTFSPDLNTTIALGLFEGGLAHENEEVIAAFPLKNEQVRLRITNPKFIDRAGTRYHV